ncbi:Aminotransferase-like, plant mobile domain [Sesbania bispinosa]|nr:Aminotransferase-like, plant mobile domain [Sesbania bispinosa]
MRQGRRRDIPEYDMTNKVWVRNSCEVQFLTQVNKHITPQQLECIKRTPFRWTPEMPNVLKICGPLLLELALRWSEQSGGFRIRGTIVPFTPLDVCVSHGLPIVRQKVSFDETEISHTESLLGGNPVTISTIMGQLNVLNRDADVEDFCRLYLLLSFAEFYFPWTSSHVNMGLVKLLDDLDNLHKYNWGVAVYEYLVGSLGRAHDVLREGRNAAQLHIVGCAAILQMWVVQHVCLCPSVTTLFPRFKSWQNVQRPTKDIATAFENNMVVCDEVEEFDVLKGGLDEAVLKGKCSYAGGKQEIGPSDMSVGAGFCGIKGDGASKRNGRTFMQRLWRQPIARRKYLVKMLDCYLNREELSSMKPHGWVSNMVFLLAPKVSMGDEIAAKGHVTRFMLSFRLVVSMIKGYKFMDKV